MTNVWGYEKKIKQAREMYKEYDNELIKLLKKRKKNYLNIDRLRKCMKNIEIGISNLKLKIRRLKEERNRRKK